MVKGFKDSDGRFHPISDKNNLKKKSNKSIKPKGMKVGSSVKMKSASSLRSEFKVTQTKLTREQEDAQTANFGYQMLNNALNWGYGDVGNAIDKANEVDLTAKELSDIIMEFHDDTETPYEDIDINYVIYDHILQMARNKIDEVLKFDIVNDIEGDTEFYTAGNYLATTYDYSQKAKDQLEERFEMATPIQISKLKNDVFVRSFLTNIDFGL